MGFLGRVNDFMAHDIGHVVVVAHASSIHMQPAAVPEGRCVLAFLGLDSSPGFRSQLVHGFKDGRDFGQARLGHMLGDAVAAKARTFKVNGGAGEFRFIRLRAKLRRQLFRRPVASAVNGSSIFRLFLLSDNILVSKSFDIPRVVFEEI